jgi:predicted GNAT family acetyltransferase
VTSSDDTTGPASSGPRHIEAAQGMAENVEVIDNVAESRYEAWVDGERAGVLDYRRRRARISMIHTEVDHRFGGRGIGTRLAGTALDAARAAGLVVLPICPLVAGYIGRNPEYEDLVVGRRRAETSSDPTGRPGGGAPDDLRPGPSTGRGDPPIGAP